jgi:hypothetical protein
MVLVGLGDFMLGGGTVQQYNKMVGTLSGNLFNDVFPKGLLAPTP